MGINTAIIGILGYLETKGLAVEQSMIFMMVPFVGMAICYSWYKIIDSYRQLDRVKFKVIHSTERNLPLALFETEWELLGKGRNRKLYRPFSMTEMNIPIIFMILYLLIFFWSFPWIEILRLAQ